jgi:hypothetical protein
MSYAGSVHLFFQEYQSFNDHRDLTWETSHRGIRRSSTPVEPFSGGGPWRLWGGSWDPGEWRVLGAGVLHGSRQGSEWWGLLVPLWGVLAALWLPWGAFEVRRRRRLRRLTRGWCLKCGYDRSSLDASQACPECGTPSRSGTP